MCADHVPRDTKPNGVSFSRFVGLCACEALLLVVGVGQSYVTTRSSRAGFSAQLPLECRHRNETLSLLIHSASLKTMCDLRRFCDVRGGRQSTRRTEGSQKGDPPMESTTSFKMHKGPLFTSSEVPGYVPDGAW